MKITARIVMKPANIIIELILKVVGASSVFHILLWVKKEYGQECDLEDYLNYPIFYSRNGDE